MGRKTCVTFSTCMHELMFMVRQQIASPALWAPYLVATNIDHISLRTTAGFLSRILNPVSFRRKKKKKKKNGKLHIAFIQPLGISSETCNRCRLPGNDEQRHSRHWKVLCHSVRGAGTHQSASQSLRHLSGPKFPISIMAQSDTTAAAPQPRPSLGADFGL